MHPKTLTKLIIFLFFLLAVWQGINWWQQKQINQNTGWVTFSTSINPDKVNKITINTDQDNLILVKKNQNWLIDGTSADIAKVEPLLKILKKPSVEIISQNQNKYQELGISDQTANKLSFWQQNEEKLTLLVSSINSKLIRQKDKQNVYRLSTNLNLSTDPEDWKAPKTATISPTQKNQ